jgi:hypothetical protein
MDDINISYTDFYQYFINVVTNGNHWFFTPRQVGMTTCGINYILKFCSDNKTNGVYLTPDGRQSDEILCKRYIDWYGWVTYRKNVIRNNGNTIYITDKYNEILYGYKNLGISIFIFDNFSSKYKFPDDIKPLYDNNVKCVFLETKEDKKFIEIKRIYNNILNNKNLILHYLTLNDFVNMKGILRKEKIIEIFGDILK